jgi:hypothetical protein
MKRTGEISTWPIAAIAMVSGLWSRQLGSAHREGSGATGTLLAGDAHQTRWSGAGALGPWEGLANARLWDPTCYLPDLKIKTARKTRGSAWICPKSDQHLSFTKKSINPNLPSKPLNLRTRTSRPSRASFAGWTWHRWRTWRESWRPASSRSGTVLWSAGWELKPGRGRGSNGMLVPSGKHTKNYGKSPFLMGESTINGHFQ